MCWDILRHEGVADASVPSCFTLFLCELQRQELWLQAGQQFSVLWDQPGAAIVLQSCGSSPNVHAGDGVCVSLHMRDEKVTALNGYSLGKGELRRWTCERSSSEMAPYPR